MGSIVVLGGAGGVGRVAVEALTTLPDSTSIVVADARPEAVRSVIDELGDPRLRAATVDVTNQAALVSLLGEADVVLNCVGPFYRFGPPTLAAAIEAGVNYVDICDDLDATRALMAMDEDARSAGVTALIGMGNSPGLANIFVKMCAEQLLDELHTAEICHVHGGEPGEGAAVLKHRIHAMVDPVPLFIDGEFVEVHQLDADGARHVREIDFAGVGPTAVHPYPHPETITLPAAFPTLTRVTNLGSVYPVAYFAMTQALVRSGMADDRPINLLDTTGAPVQVTPVDATVALLQRERPRLLAEAGVTEPGGCLRVEVTGTVDGEPHTYVCSLNSQGAGAGEGTGIPAALGAALMQRGTIGETPGVFPPEAIVPVDDILNLASTVVSALGIGHDGAGHGAAGIPLTIEHTSPDGTTEIIPMALG